MHESRAQEKYTSDNSLQLILTSDTGSLQLRSNELIAAYDPALGCFFFRINRNKFIPVSNPGHDQGLWNAFQYLPQDLPFIIRIYTKNDPLDFDRFEGKNKSLPASIEFGNLCFEDIAVTSRLISGKDLILKFSIDNNFNPPLYLANNALIPINHIKIISKQVIIYGFVNQLND